VVARLARIALVNIPYHVTQRGNARQFILSCDEERKVYLDLLRKYVTLHELELLGYCLMSNHVHLVVIPRKSDSLAQALKQTHGRYATYWNATRGSSGHAWQGRFYSCPLDDSHLWMALRYVERNPVRAGLTDCAWNWCWSSAATHCGESTDESVNLQLWKKRWSAQSWREYLTVCEARAEIDMIRRSTHTGRPLGGEDFVHSLEEATQRRLASQKGGRTKGVMDTTSQITLAFDK
jgi:putative transposase